MRIVKRCHLLLLFSLALLLVCGQLPELFTLIDDTSNDFVEVDESLAPASKDAEVKPTAAISQSSFVLDVVLGGVSNRTVAVMPSNQSVASFSPDLLRLLTTQRK